MDSLFANYASSDDEDEQKESPKSLNPAPTTPSTSTSTTGAFFSSLPPPKPSSFPPPKSHLISNHSTERRRQSVHNGELPKSSPSPSPKLSTSLFSSIPQPKSSSASLFSSLPQPKSHDTEGLHLGPAKRVVQFRPPVNPSSSSSAGGDDEDGSDEEEKPKKKQEIFQTASVRSFLSSIPAPRNSATLGVSSLASGTGRRSIIDADVPGLKNSNVLITDNEVGVSNNQGYYEDPSSGDAGAISSSDGVSQSSEYAVGGEGGDHSNWASGTAENYAGYGGYVGYGGGVSGDYQTANYASYSSDYGNYENYGQYESNRVDGSTGSMGPDVSGMPGNAFKMPSKRGRNNAPPEIVEVKQDELMKNRPREDQAKLTGIAFGPSYQPTSTKGKPSKLHKRKHQIGSLFFDMKQKEMELAERRAKGFLTKAQTQGKYGW